MKQISVKMDDVLYNQLVEFSKREDRKISEMVRVALKEYFERESKKKQEVKR